VSDAGERGWSARWRRRVVAAPDVLLRRGIEAYNRALLGLPRGRPGPEVPEDFREVLERARTPTDISHHLPTLFREAVDADARFIVELGTRGGDSTFVFERAARRTGATVVSVDLDDCSAVSGFDGWIFVQDDDLAFARRFPAWCAERGLQPAADILFVDTTHDYEQTRAELAAWMRYLAPRGRALFHDSNMGGLYRRGDWTVGLAGDMGRGVARALHEFLGATFDERRRFDGRIGAFRVRHDPLCNGLTVLERVEP
jgi:cephalosporin hydroxylase